MFIPFRAGIKVTRIPVMTIAVSIVCLLVYWAQEHNLERIQDSAASFCTPQVAAVIDRGQKRDLHTDLSCWQTLAGTYVSANPEADLEQQVAGIKAAGDPDAARAFDEDYRAFAAQAPVILTDKLVKYSGSWNPVRMFTSVIAHASWDHVISNLFFFVAFAMVVETVIGPARFLLVFLALTFGSGALQNMLTITTAGNSGLGLSGVVMWFLTLAAYFSPKVKIRFFYFFFLFIGILSWPLWSVAAWYVISNIWYYIFFRDEIAVGFDVHLAGAAMGLILGIVFFRKKRHWVEEQILPDELTLKDDESWLYKLNAIGATPVVLYFVLVYGVAAYLLAIYLIIRFIHTFAVQLLLVAPAVAAAIQFYRIRPLPKAQWGQYRNGMAALDAHHFQEALRILNPLAEGGYARAQFALGRLYASRVGGYYSEAQAVRWFEAAANRGNANAQHELGSRHLRGEHVPKDLSRAVHWLEKAAAQGLGHAAQSLGYLYENLWGSKGDKDKAIEWYYRAAVAFRKSGHNDDAMAMVRHLESLTTKYPAVRELVTELEELLGN